VTCAMPCNHLVRQVGGAGRSLRGFNLSFSPLRGATFACSLGELKSDEVPPVRSHTRPCSAARKGRSQKQLSLNRQAARMGLRLGRSVFLGPQQLFILSQGN